MELKIFGRKIFEFNKENKGALLVYNSTESLKKSEFLPDFHTFRAASNNFLSDSATFVALESLQRTADENPLEKKEEKPVEKKEELTPKKVHELKMLNESFLLNTDAAYVDDQIQQFKDKLALIQMAEYDVSRGTNEIASILVRMENRKKYEEFKGVYEEYVYTTTSKINDVIKNNDYLQLGKVEQFMADMPKEAVDAMKQYTKTTQKLCDKKPIFYIIANKKDFEKRDKRRDPILLAQSPFGHFWQILGAWDEEMLFLEEL